MLTFLPALVIFLSRVLVAALGHAGIAAPPRARGAHGGGGGARRPGQRIVLRVGPAHSARLRHRGPPWVRQAQDEAFDWIFSRTAAALREHEDVVRVRRLDPRVLPGARRPWSSPSRATHAHIHGSVPRCSTCRSTRCTSSTSEAGAGLPRIAAVGHLSTIPEVEINLPSTVERLVVRRPLEPDDRPARRARRDRDPAAAISTCCRSARSPSTTRTTPSSARSLLAAPSAPRVPGRGEPPAAAGGATASSSRPPCFRSRSSSRASGTSPGLQGFRSTIRGSICTSRAISPAAPASPATRAYRWPDRPRRCRRCCSARAPSRLAALAMAKVVGILATLGAALLTRRNAALAWGARGRRARRVDRALLDGADRLGRAGRDGGLARRVPGGRRAPRSRARSRARDGGVRPWPCWPVRRPSASFPSSSPRAP